MLHGTKQIEERKGRGKEGGIKVENGVQKGGQTHGPSRRSPLKDVGQTSI